MMSNKGEILQSKVSILCVPLKGLWRIIFTGMAPCCLHRSESPLRSHYSRAFTHCTPCQKPPQRSPKGQRLGVRVGLSVIHHFLPNKYKPRRKAGKGLQESKAQTKQNISTMILNLRCAPGQVHSQRLHLQSHHISHSISQIQMSDGGLFYTCIILNFSCSFY